MHSSQNEQDNRLITLFSRLPMFEPSTVQECYNLAREAIKVSYTYKIPVILRLVTRVSHALGIVRRTEKTPPIPIIFEKNSNQFVNIPGNARKNHHRIINLRKKLKEEVLNEHYWEEEGDLKNARYLIVTSGSSANYAKEAINLLNLDAYFFIPKLIAPFPEKKIVQLIPYFKELIIIEELEPYLETKVKHVVQSNRIDVRIYGKDDGVTLREGELTTDKLVSNIAKILNIKYSGPKSLTEKIKSLIKIRPPVLCAGCPHRSTYVLINDLLKKKNPIYCNDIGCYSLGVLPPHKTADILICMGASIPMATSISMTKEDSLGVALIGDSTFWHSGIPGLANAIWKEVDILIVIMDNQTTAMTGDQPNPSTRTGKLDIAATVKAMGAETITINPMNYQEYRKSLPKFINKKGVKVIVSKYPCALNIARDFKLKSHTLPLAKIVEENCNGCKLCVTPLGCPALTIDANNIAKIDQSLCNGCMYCAEHCRRDAIVEVDR
ncbi:MAG: thiamine pyrophosphate-dependent enzyme [Candidatus Kariarchaeaceae archaeon]|jgi:indolepyruvate ferredoxin oxidoreductase alpha subunit